MLTQQDLEEGGFDQRPVVTLKSSPGIALTDGETDERDPAQGQGIGIEGEGWSSKGLSPGAGGEYLLAVWKGWYRGRHYNVANGGLIKLDRGSKL